MSDVSDSSHASLFGKRGTAVQSVFCVVQFASACLLYTVVKLRQSIKSYFSLFSPLFLSEHSRVVFTFETSTLWTMTPRLDHDYHGD